MITRFLERSFLEGLQDPKAIFILGSRQCGKTTLVKRIVALSSSNPVWWSGDEPDDRLRLANISSTKLKGIAGGKNLS